MNKKIKNITPIALSLTALFFVSFSYFVSAESTVVTTTGTYRCDNACVVDGSGGVTDSSGGRVWKMVVPEAPRSE